MRREVGGRRWEVGWEVGGGRWQVGGWEVGGSTEPHRTDKRNIPQPTPTVPNRIATPMAFWRHEGQEEDHTKRRKITGRERKESYVQSLDRGSGPIQD